MGPVSVRRISGDRDRAVGKFLGRPGLSFVAIVDAATFEGEYEILDAMNFSFRLPAYFGWNWDALYDCLSNLEWLEADRYVLLIENSDRLDVQGSQAHIDFVAALGRVLRAWAPAAFAPDRRAVEFIVMLDRGDAPFARVQQEFGTLGIGVEEA
jgi:hypothetical protein